MCLNLKAMQPLFRASALVLDVNALSFMRVMGAKVVFPLLLKAGIFERRLERLVQAAEPAV